MKGKTHDFNRPQPRDQVEMQNVAAEALGQQPSDKKAHSPRFHRMSITAAENGYSVDHTTSDPDGDKDKDTTDPSSRPGGDRQTTTTHLIHSGHPAHPHVQAMHDHFMSERKSNNGGISKKPY